MMIIRFSNECGGYLVIIERWHKFGWKLVLFPYPIVLNAARMAFCGSFRGFIYLFF